MAKTKELSWVNLVIEIEGTTIYQTELQCGTEEEPKGIVSEITARLVEENLFADFNRSSASTRINKLFLAVAISAFAIEGREEGISYVFTVLGTKVLIRVS